MRLLVLLAATGCGFTHGALPSSDANLDGDAATDAPDASSDDAPDASIPLCDPADLDLRSCFTFDGSVTEGASYSHNIQVAQVSFVPGHDGQAAAIANGSNITITGTPTSFDVTTFTFRMWIKPTSFPTGTNRMGLIDSGNRYRLFLLASGALRCAITNGPDLTTTTNKVQLGIWQRVACTFNGAALRIYVDGQQVGALSQTATVPTSTSGIVIGQNNPSGENLDGAIDSFQLFGAVVDP